MSAPAETRVDVGGHACRVWSAGDGPTVGYLAGLVGLPRWTPFLTELSAKRRVIAPSLPGFPGADGFRDLDDLLDWIVATRTLVEGAGLDGADLVGASVGGALAAEIAALWPTHVRRLVLIAPLGLYETDMPPADPFAQKPGTLGELLVNDPAAYEALNAQPNDADETEWQVAQIRAQEAAARLLWPLGETGLRKRLGRIACPTLLIWGADDRLVSPGYAGRFAELITGPVETATIKGAGHLADLDQPAAVAKLIEDFLAKG